MTAAEKRDIMDGIDVRMREVTTMIGSIERAFTDFKNYLETLVKQQQQTTEQLRENQKDLYEKRTELIASVTEIDKKLTTAITELDKRLVSVEKDIMDIKEDMKNTVDGKRFMWTTVIAALAFVVTAVYLVVDHLPKGQ